jgi:subtilisin family serine protease
MKFLQTTFMVMVSVALVLLMLDGSDTAQAGNIDPDLENIIAKSDAEQTITVLVFLSDQVDLKGITSDLNAQKASRSLRHETVIRALRDKASFSQYDIIKFLEVMRTGGELDGFRTYWIVNAIAVDAAKEAIEVIANRPDVATVYYDYGVGIIDPMDYQDGGMASGAGPEIGIVAVRAPEVWALGVTGQGVLVSNIDTGVDGVHPALASRWAGVADPRYAGHPEWAWFDPYLGQNDFPYDGGYHGTHTMGTLCGGLPGDEVGVAPGVHWIASGAIDRGGSVETTVEDIIEAFEWLVDPDGNPATSWDVPNVMSNSWGVHAGHGYTPCDTLFWSYVDACEAAGTVVFFAAGNEGLWGLRRPADRASDSYNTCAVAAVDANLPNWPVTGFSSRGPTYCTPDSSAAIKPDIAAPGGLTRSSIPGGGYAEIDGTSMACPHVTGVAALMLEVNPNLTGDEVKQIIYETAYDLGPPGEDNAYGWGMVDAYEAVMLAIADIVPEPVSTVPVSNQLDVSLMANISITFNTLMDETTINGSTIVVNARSTGLHTGTFNYDGSTRTVTFDPDYDFDNGEVVTVDLTTGIQSMAGVPLENSYSWSFTVAVGNESPGTFVTDTVYTVGEQPIGIVNADFNGDGHIDLATANADGNNILVLLNTGDGSFVSGGFYTADNRPCELSAADLDGDGDIDLAVSNWNSNKVSIFLNAGDGTFPSRADYPAGVNPIVISAADFDGDGDLDLAVSNWNSDDISMLINDGNGIFAIGPTYPAVDGPNDIQAADFDGDGDPDLAVASSYMDVVAVYLNHGDGTFAAYVGYPVGECPEGLAAADLDGDGDVDMATANKVSSTVSVLFNDGYGAFLPSVPYEVGAFSGFIFAGDYDGDGDIDLATNNIIGYSATVLLNAGNGAFGYRLDYPIGDHAGAICAADYDNDSDLDLAAVGQLSDMVTILINEDIAPRTVSVSPYQNELNVPVNSNISATFDLYLDGTTIADSTFVVHASSKGLQPGIFSYDSTTMTVSFNPSLYFEAGEIITTSLTSGLRSFKGIPLDSNYVWSFTADAEPGQGTFVYDTGYGAPNLPYSVFAADLNGDRYLDLITQSSIDSSVQVRMNNGDGTFASPATYYASGSTWSVYAGDLDNDGDMDLATATYGRDKVSVLKNDGFGIFGAYTDFHVPLSPGSIYGADLDGDGDLDLVTSHNPLDVVAVLLNNGDATFENYVPYPIGHAPSAVSGGDIDKDGDVDLVSSNYGTDDLSVLENNGNGTFGLPTNYSVGDGPSDVEVADVNNDGNLDLISSNFDENTVSILLNYGLGTFGDDSTYAVGSDPLSVCAADFDGDDDMDLATTNSWTNDVSILDNNGDGTFAGHETYDVGGYPWGIFAVDLDDDGDVDLATADGLANQVSVLFNCPLDPPAAPTLVSPANGSNTTDHTPTLDWSDADFADTYEVVVDNDPNFGSINRSKSGLTGSRWTVYPSITDGTWYWKARAHNEAGAGQWSVVWHFTVYTSGGGDPSCPVLFSYNGTDFVQENPLLTACEKSGYIEVVTDFYHLHKPLAPMNGSFVFQLREMEDEVSYLHDIALITVDHRANTKVACSVDGRISTFSETMVPLSAIDHQGVDRLAEIIEVDGRTFVSAEPGYLIVTFPNNAGAETGIRLKAPPKPIWCEHKVIPDTDGKAPELIVEILDAAGNWIELSTVPARTESTDEILFTDLVDDIDGEILTIRLSWNRHYAADAIGQIVPSDETPLVHTWRADSYHLRPANAPMESWDGFADGQPMILTKGDLFEFSFVVDRPIAPEHKRDYIIRAVGRYQPDYSIYSHLLPELFQLHGNYPNPFNPATTISYDIPVASEVQLAVYNVLGQHIKTLVEKHQQPGRYQVVWDSRDDNGESVASGIYFYYLKAGEFNESRKMILLK